MNTFNNICLIPAKGASKRLKKKNILKINNKELIYYPIKAASNSKIFMDNIFVSTELTEIGRIAQKYGAKVHFREKKLAFDPYGVKDVALEFLKRNKFNESAVLTILLPTAPLISKEDIIEANNEYKKQKCKYLMSIVETDYNALRSVFFRSDSTIRPVFKEFIEKKSQELKTTYRINGAIIILDIKDFLKTKKFFNYPLGAYIMPKERSIDIDTEFDYRIAKFLMEKP